MKGFCSGGGGIGFNLWHRAALLELLLRFFSGHTGFIRYNCMHVHTEQESVSVCTGVYRNGSLRSHILYVTSCVLECCLHPTTPPWHTHTPCTQTHTYSTLDRPGCQSYTNSHPLAAGFQDNHGNQSLTPGETSSRTERLHSISTSQYSTHKRTHMHTFHTLTHSHWQVHTHTDSHTHTRTWTCPTQPTCSNSLAVTPASPACLHWGEWELVRDRTLHPLTHGPRLHIHSTPVKH